MEVIFKKYFFESAKHSKMLITIYIIQFTLSGIIGLIFKDLVSSGFGHSMLSKNLLSEFDFTAFIDFLHLNSQRIISFVQAFKYFLLIWIILSIILSTGQIYYIGSGEQFNLGSFLQISLMNFWSQIRIIAFFIFILVLWICLICLPFIFKLEFLLDHYSSEKYVIWMLVALLLISLLAGGFIMVCSTLSRNYHLQDHSKILVSIKFGVKKGFSQFTKHIILILLYFGLLFSLLIIYLFIESKINSSSFVLILFLFLIQQVFALAKLLSKQLLIAGILN